MVARAVTLCDYIEQERLHIIVERLVIKKHLGKQAQVLAVDLVLPAIDLVHADVAVTIDLVAWWMSHLALESVTLCHEAALHVLEAELADPQTSVGYHAVLFWIRRLVPSVDIELAKADAFDW